MQVSECETETGIGTEHVVAFAGAGQGIPGITGDKVSGIDFRRQPLQ
jgi:hypothetical protein